MHFQSSYGSEPIFDGMNPFGGDEKPLVRYISGIARRKWLVLLGISLGMALAAAYVYTRAPIYPSTAVVRVAMSLPSFGNAGFSDYFTNFTLYYETVVQGLTTGAAPGNRSRQSGRLTDLLDGKVDVNPKRGTSLITLQMTANEPLLAKKKLQDYIETFIQLQRKEVEDGTRDFLSAMERDVREVEQQMIKSQTELREFSIKNGLVLSHVDPQMASSLDRAGANFAHTKDRRLDLEITASQRQRLLPSKINDEYLRKLKHECANMRTEYVSMNTAYAPEYINMRVLKNKIDTFERAINDIEGNMLTASLVEAKKQEASAKEIYERAKSDLMEKSPIATQFSILTKAADADARMYLGLKDKLWHAKLYSSMMANSLDVYSPPTLPIAPIYPNKPKTVALGALLGLVAGIALTVVLEYTDKTAGHVDSIKRLLDIPILGVVPLSAGEFKPSDDIAAFLAAHFPVSPFADALYVAHYSASRLMSTQSGTALCVASSLPAEGKTLISLALAKIVASENKRVLVIDGDMRKHRASDLFGIEHGISGLSDILKGTCPDVRDAVRESGIPGIYFMSSGPSSENPVALLKAPAMGECIEKCRKDFDLVIIDSPPVVGMVDASVIGCHTDGVIMVVKHGATPVEVVREAVRSLLQMHVDVLGIIVNMVKETGASYYARYYRNADRRG